MGADMNIRAMTEGDTPLGAAASVANLDVAKLLVAARCDLDLANRTGHTPLCKAAHMGQVELTKLLACLGGLY